MLCLGCLAYAVVKRLNVPTTVVGFQSTDQRKKGLDLRIDLSSKLFDLSLLLLGAIWGLVLAEKVSIHFSRWQETALFITSNLLVLLSMFFHLVYRIRMANLLWDLAQNDPAPANNPSGVVQFPGPAPTQFPDIRDAFVEFPLTTQYLLFFAALCSGFFTILIAKVLGS